MVESFHWVTAPVHSTIRQWLLKVGLFKLNKIKDPASHWVLIGDATIQMGLQKVLMILGVRLESLKDNFCPSFENVEPLVVRVIESCPGEIVKEAFEEAIEKVGKGVVATLTDSGAEMKKGTALLQKPSLSNLRDIVHLVNNKLKKSLSENESWKNFREKSAHLVQFLKLSSFAHLIPPRQRTKERLLASADLITWGINLLAHIESGVIISEWLRERIDWIKEYRQNLKTWENLIFLCKSAIEHVQKNGYYRGIGTEWKKLCCVCINEGWSQVGDFIAELAEVLNAEGNKVPEGKRYIGSSVIIESVFGKFKQLEGVHACSGMTSLVLALPAILGETTTHIIEEAMNTVSAEDLDKWIQDNMGQTYLSKRRQAFGKKNIANKNLDICENYRRKTA